MGVAAYNRGSARISADIDAALPGLNELLMRDLTELSAREGKGDLFKETVIRRYGDGWLLMNQPEKGWMSYSYPFKSLWDIAREYRLEFVGAGRDEFSGFIAVRPLPAKGKKKRKD